MIKKGLHICLVFLWCANLNAQQFQSDTSLILMGTSFSLKAVAASELTAKASILSGILEIQRIEALISSHKTTSQTSRVNAYSGLNPVKVDKELWDLVYRSKKISKLTQGKFDISFRPLYKIWKYHRKLNQFPPKDSINKYSSLVNYKDIILQRSDTSICLKTKGMQIDFGAIGKGYAANKAKQVMQKNGASSGFVNASGDILFWGSPVGKDHWAVGIKHPEKPSAYLGWLHVNNMAVVTSGDYEKNFEFNGKKYSHIINPTTGYPIVEAKSVTIICPDAELADALATATSVLGATEGMRLINRLKGVEALFIDSNYKVVSSKNLKLQSSKPE